MRFWPSYSTSFWTSLPPDEALRRLHDEIGPDKGWVMIGPFNAHVGLSTDRRMFLGHPLSDGGEFQNKLTRDPGELRRFNSFQAVVKAQIEPSKRGSTVHVSLRIGAFVAALLAAWCIPFVWATAAFANAILRGDDFPPWLLLSGPALIGLAWLIVCYAFSEDADTAERMLRATIERD